MTVHVRADLPRRGGNSFYRDRRDLSAHVRTLCGAPVTDRDVTRREAMQDRTRRWFAQQAEHALCPACMDEVVRQAMAVISVRPGGGR